jgi:hypothetical protein
MLMKTMETTNAGLGPETTTTNPSTRAEGAKSMLERVAAWELEIPVFDFPVPEGDRRALTHGRLVPPDFVEEITAIMRSADLASRGGHADEVHDLMEYSVVYGPVAAAIERLGAKMRHSVDTARAKAGAEALLTFSVVERLAQVPGTKHLAPTVEALRRTLRTVPTFRPKKSKKAATETPAPAPAPSPVVTAPVPVVAAVDPHKP